MRTRKTQEEIKSVIEDFEKSGMSQRSYAESKGYNQKTFNRWVLNSKITDALSEKNSRFVEVTLPAVRPKEITIKKSGMEIMLPVGMSENDIKSVLKAVAAV